MQCKIKREAKINNYTYIFRWVSSRRGLDADDPEWQEAEKKLDRAWYNMGEGIINTYTILI